MSYYDIFSNTWKRLNAELNESRVTSSACTLKGIVYVFYGNDFLYRELNSIEMIAESSLLSNSTATWELIDVPQKDLGPCSFLAVAPLNDTEIAILGGKFKKSNVIVFDTTTKECRLVIAPGD